MASRSRTSSGMVYWVKGASLWRVIGNSSLPSILPYCTAYRTTDLSTSADAVVFNAEEDPYGMHAAGAANITILSAGVYMVSAMLIASTVDNPDGSFYGAYIKVNGGQVIGANRSFYKSAYRTQLAMTSRAIMLAANDTIALSYEYEAGGSRYYYADSYLSVVRIG